jgi:hypothetical protein
VSTPEPALLCPMAGCDHFEWISPEDPDCTLSELISHLQSYFTGGHRLSQKEAMRQLANAEEVLR